MENTHREIFKVKFYDTDFTSQAKLYTLVNFMQETSEQHSNNIGIGYNDLINEGLFWVVSRIKVNMKKYPKNMDTVIMETWPSGIDRMFFKRNFRLLDEGGEELGTILAYYLLVDVNSKFPQRASKLKTKVQSIENRFKIDEKLEKIIMKEKLIETMERILTYNDIDLNLHANNSRYISWVEDLFPLEQYKDQRIKELQLNYIKEVKIEDVIVLNKYIDEKAHNTYYIEGLEKNNNTQFFQCKVVFDETV